MVNARRSRRDSYFAKVQTRIVVLLICELMAYGSAAHAQAQDPASLTPDTGGNLENRVRPVTVSTGVQQSNVLLTVLNETKARLDRQAVIKLHDQNRDVTVWQTTTTDSESVFRELNYGDYDLEVSALGFLTTHMLLGVAPTLDVIRVQVVMLKDPTAIELTASEDAIPPRERKNAKRTIYELNSGHLDEAEKRLQKLYKLAPSNAQVNFLYGYLFLQRKDLEKSETYLMRSAASDPRRIQTFILLGRVQLQRQHYEDARKTLERAVNVEPQNWIAHNLLADTYLRQGQYGKAQEQAQLAIDQGKDATSVAQLVLGQALVNMGRDVDGIIALRSFIEHNPQNPVVAQVQKLVKQVENSGFENQQSPQTRAGMDLMLSAARPNLLPSTWAPPGIDTLKPPVATDVS